MRTVSPTLAVSGLVADQRADRAVEDDVGRALVDGLRHVERLQARLAVAPVV
jgi:hypothetical protein